jgi:hypothetical protein
MVSLGPKFEVFLKYYSSKGSNLYAMGMASLLGTTKQEKDPTPLDTNVATKNVSRRQREKMQMSIRHWDKQRGLCMTFT